MKPPNKTISSVIIDDHQTSINAFKSQLFHFEDIEILGAATCYKEAKKLILEEQPDLIFLDVEMQEKTGFELLYEIREQTMKPFSFIYLTCKKHSINTLPGPALDLLSKPVKTEELRRAIERYQYFQFGLCKSIKFNEFSNSESSIIALPVSTGLKFIKKSDLVALKYEKEEGWSRSYWYATLLKQERIRLKSGVNSTQLLDIIGDHLFIPVNQSAIVNLNYINSVEIKSHECILQAPFEMYRLPVSRKCMVQIRQRFDYI